MDSNTAAALYYSWAAMWATAADIIFKHIFGRASPDPTYTQNHLYGFRLLHGGRHCNCVGSLHRDATLAGSWRVDRHLTVRCSGHHQPLLG
jgi:hypothetical protein